MLFVNDGASDTMRSGLEADIVPKTIDTKNITAMNLFISTNKKGKD